MDELSTPEYAKQLDCDADIIIGTEYYNGYTLVNTDGTEIPIV